MRTLLVLAAVCVLAACGSGETTESSAELIIEEEPTLSTTEESVLEDTALPPLTSVPVSEIDASHVGPPVSFDTSPSTGGAHYQFWHNCGFYNVELLEGAATHTMEHGAVWITYNAASTSADDLATLEAMAADNGKLIISPYPHDDAIVLSAWGVQQRGVDSVSDDAVGEFIDTWVDNPDLPEAGVRCTGAAGVPPDDIRSFPDGAQVPEDFQ